MLNQFTDPAEFLRRAGDFLERHEAENNLLLEISSWLASHPDRIDQTPYFVTVEENGRIQAAAMMTPPHNLVLTESEPETIAAIVEHAFANGLVLPGVNGPSKTSKTFALLWSKRTGHAFHLHRSLRIYELTRVKLARPVNGKLRLASESDLEILVHWTRAFGVDIREQQSEEGLAKLVRGVIADQRLYVWEDGGLGLWLRGAHQLLMESASISFTRHPSSEEEDTQVPVLRL